MSWKMRPKESYSTGSNGQPIFYYWNNYAVYFFSISLSYTTFNIIIYNNVSFFDKSLKTNWNLKLDLDPLKNQPYWMGFLFTQRAVQSRLPQAKNEAPSMVKQCIQSAIVNITIDVLRLIIRIIWKSHHSIQIVCFFSSWICTGIELESYTPDSDIDHLCI